MIDFKPKDDEPVNAFIKRLIKDPNTKLYMEQRKQQRKESEYRIREAEAPVLEELARLGFQVNKLSDWVNSNYQVPPQVIDVLMKWLPIVAHVRIQEMIIRSLGAPERLYDGRPLAELYERIDTPEGLRWVIGNTIECALPTNITEWVVSTVQNASYGGARSRLCLALIKMVPPDQSIPILQSVFDQLPTPCAEAFGTIGNDESIIRFLREKEQNLMSELPQKKKGTIPYNKVKTAIKEIQSAIKKIEKRMLRGQKKKNK